MCKSRQLVKEQMNFCKYPFFKKICLKGFFAYFANTTPSTNSNNLKSFKIIASDKLFLF